MTELMTYSLLFISVVLSSVAQILQKYAALHSNETDASLFANRFVWLSFTCLGLALLLWLAVLSELAVSTAYPLLSLSYVVVMLLARTLFKEHIPLRRWLGALLIILGITCLKGTT
ncbi:4-amino-4-deoxy-L-arabinose-phospho-UDP flippase [Leucothrix sargassi]|nr:4-amino-4-deoxy-L-arabinose-phospho-UDP flippase [Leucothrix sargassi]